MDLSNITSEDGRGEKIACDRCAGCCTGGGPVLRMADAHLIRSGKIPSKCLYTIRKGELLFNKDKMKMLPTETDMIKIKILKDTFECHFLENNSSCTIYMTRPIECRAFKCWDTKEIESKYDEQPLERKDVLSEVEGLWELIEDHQERCSYEKMTPLVAQLDSEETMKSAMDAINDIVKYDLALRNTFVEKANVDPEMLDFLLGRPFTSTIAMFNHKIEKKDGNYYLTPIKT